MSRLLKAAIEGERGRVIPWWTREERMVQRTAERHPPWAPALKPSLESAHRLGEPQPLEFDHYAVSLDRRLDRAEGWDCPGGAFCRNRAYVGRLHRTAEEARAFVPQHSLEWTKRVLNVRPQMLAAKGMIAEGPLPNFHVVHVKGQILGYDYRMGGCRLPDAFNQLWHHEGRGPAWGTVLAHRAKYGAQGAALPGRTSGGLLFAFVTGCEDLSMTPVDCLPGRLPDDLQLP